MRFITFQPKLVVDELNKNGIYTPQDNEHFGRRIFALKIDKNIMERVFMCAPSMPQVAIIFEADNFVELDSVAWVNELHLGIHNKTDTKYKEYTFDKINKSDVLEIINISDSDDPDEVQDDFMDTHFRELEKLSGHKWYRLCDREDLVGSCESLELMRYIHLCMMPYREVTEKDYDTWAEIIRKLFIKKENAYEV
ncbi:MAG: hypothetical protein J6A59_11270 [Lachnospiraceae bacterium]|nr:hypothetical protein [Lachnospiraceae bacterium]